MKLAKRISALLLALVLVLGMTMTASAETTTPQNPSGAESGVGSGTGAIKGKITINNAVVGETYTIYKLLDLESYNRAEGKNVYSYKTAAAWSAWLKTQTAYVTVDGNNYVEWVKNEDAEAFAKAALAYAKVKENNITATATEKASSTTVVFENLELGYYLLDTSLGALCSLDSTDQEIVIKEKNAAPTITKLVLEDADRDNTVDTTEEWKSSNTAQIGDTVYFKTTINAYKGAEKYVLHDAMEAGFILNEESVEVTNLTKGTDYTVVTSENALCKDCDFHIVFSEQYLETITGTEKEPSVLTVTYRATLNGNADISEEENVNKTWLEYGDDRKTEECQTSTTTYKFGLVKTDNNKKILTGAKFKLYTPVYENGTIKTDGKGQYVLGTEISLYKGEDGSYRPLVSGETSNAEYIEVGNAVIKGLDANTKYLLSETVAPVGYNVLAGPVLVEMGNSNNDAAVDIENNTYTSGGVQVINEAGIRLPSTGGIGTTIFYVAGGALVLVAVVLLVTKRRMENENK